MVSLQRRRVRRQRPWYLVESGRVKGKPRIVWQKYLGTPARIKKLLEQAEKGGGPIEVDVANFGPAVPLRLAQELEIVQTIDRLLPKRNQGYSVGEHILIAVLNRCHTPCSKLQTRPWFDDTVLPRLLGKKKGLSSQDFWNHMDRIDDATIDTIQMEVTRRAVERYGLGLGLDLLFYDPTNFSTYIQEHDDRGNELPERGKPKDHRTDLRLIGLALLASRDHGIPLLHRTYPGNEHDAPLFAEEIPHVCRWLKTLGRQPSEVTLVFDKGNNSKTNLDLLEEAKFHYVGSLRPSLNRDLLEVPFSQFRRCYGDGEATTHTYRVRRKAHEREVTVVMTYSLRQEKYLRARLEDILVTAEKKLQEWATALREGQKKKRSRGRYKLVTCRKQVKELLGSSEKLFRWEVTRRGRGPIEAKWSRDEEAIRQRSLGFGRTLIFTDRDEWDDEAIVRAYRAKAAVEENFRRLKDPSYLADTPEYHWTDSKIKVHQLVCFLSLQLMGLLQRHLHQTGHVVTIDELARGMQQWYQVVLLYPDGKVERRFRPLNPVQEALYKELHLEAFA